ncbi:MAG: energy transducer TonB [Cyclobacteriaceae bacterium]|nr:energy transducer TonB [Cyclobacteriaceae bacterium]
MKQILNLFLLVAAFVLVQACGPKKENTEETMATETSVSATPKLTVEERRAKIEKDKADRAAARRARWEEKLKTSPTYTDENGVVVYNKAEVDPMYVGGEDAMNKYLRDNLMYPETAKEQELEGTVFVDFVVAKDGVVRNVVVTDEGDVDQSLRMEAIRVVSNMPKWVAGSQKGKPVDTYYSLPVSFVLY